MKCPPFFLLGVLWFQNSSLRPLMHFELIFVHDVRWGSCFSLFFCMWTFSFPNTICWRDYPFPIGYLGTLVVWSFNHIHKGLFLGSILCSIGLYVCLCTDTILFFFKYYCCFVICSEFKKCGLSRFVLPSWDCFSYLKSFEILFELGIFFYFCKNAVGFWWGLH
jgi:hypothetical protein